MKKKLTKIDSMSSGEVNAEVINAAFFALLTRSGLYLDYFHYWAKETHFAYGITISQDWENWSKIATPSQYIQGAFVWDKTNIPLCVWNDMNTKWNEWLTANIKK